jgi:formate hydrogenlyase subunit 3/multisubunit Na+/H+ antiporter MnhD subunit
MTPAESASCAPWLVIAPLAGAGLSFLLPHLAMGVGLLAGAVVCVCSAHLVGQVLSHGAFRYSVGGWGAPLGIDLVVDGLCAWLVALTALIGATVSVYAFGYFADDRGAPGCTPAHERRFFWPLWLFLWAGLNALFLSGDVFNLYVTLELLGFSAVALVALANTAGALTAALRYLLASLLGSLCFLLGVALLYGAYATVDLAWLATAARPDAATRVALVLMTGGLLLKGAVFPLHFWLPPAHSSAPAPVSALLSALVVKAPIYILLRLWFVSFAAVKTEPVSVLLGVVGAGAVVWGGIHALQQPRLKLLVAYSTVAQLGYVFLVFPLAHEAAAGFAGWSGGLFFIAAHACAKAAMFLAAGNVLYALGHDDLSRLDGLARVLPKSVFALALAGVSLMGLPPSGGFIAKWVLLHAAIQQGQWWVVATILTGTALAIGYVMRVVSRALAEPATAPLVEHVPASMEWTALALAVLAAAMGLAFFAPLQLLRAGAPVMGPVLTGGGP